MGNVLIRVDDDDRMIGTASKRWCHTGRGKRHRAYLVMLFNRRGELLLARRHPRKWLWPGWWDGTVAGHVEPGETYASAARRRTYEEMGVRPRLRQTDVFTYTARYGKNGENEMCAILEGRCEKVDPNPREADAVTWMKAPKGRLTPWLKIALKRRAQLRRRRS